jgi:hypothetical protein
VARRGTRSTALLALLALVLVGCVGPALQDEHYLGKARASLEATRRHVDAVRLAADAAGRGQATGHLTAVILRQESEAAAWAASSFASRQPPPAYDDLRDRTLALHDEATSLLERLRIQAFRGEVEQLGGAVDELEELAERLERRAEELAP